MINKFFQVSPIFPVLFLILSQNQPAQNNLVNFINNMIKIKKIFFCVVQYFCQILILFLFIIFLYMQKQIFIFSHYYLLYLYTGVCVFIFIFFLLFCLRQTGKIFHNVMYLHNLMNVLFLIFFKTST